MLSPMLLSALPFTLGRAKSTQTLEAGVLTYWASDSLCVGCYGQTLAGLQGQAGSSGT